MLKTRPAARVPDMFAYLDESAIARSASTMASDGRRLYVIFANGDLGAFTFEGKLVWAKGLGPLKNPYGHAASLATWRDRLILQLDQGAVRLQFRVRLQHAPEQRSQVHGPQRQVLAHRFAVVQRVFDEQVHTLTGTDDAIEQGLLLERERGGGCLLDQGGKTTHGP